MKSLDTKVTFDIGDGRNITIETGKLARQADGSVIVRMDGTMLLATVVSNKEAKEGLDYFPLSVDYQEKFAAAGRIPGGFLKREGRLSDREILVSRLVDRAIRPLFPDGYKCETQVTITMISADGKVVPDALAALATSAAITVSNIPFNGPISEARVARINGQLVVNPYMDDLENADIDIMVGATLDNVVMVEGEMSECSEKDLIEAISFAHEAIKKQCKAQLDLAKSAGISSEKRAFEPPEENEELKEKIEKAASSKITDTAKAGMGKTQRTEAFNNIKLEFLDTLSEEELEEQKEMVNRYFHDLEKSIIRKMILDKGLRLDSRKLDEIRELSMEIDYLPYAHGSALFTRGETQSLTTVTLGAKMDQQIIDTALHDGYNKFMLHYNFPAFSTGEVKPNRGPGRREVGHGNLAMRSLKRVLPSKDDNPYTIRVVSDILESNGSSSMATVCAGSLALMDAGIKIKNNVAGIAMGLISDDKTNKTAILTDILGDEDHLGDMDFKVAGTREGICACQMDIKIDGLSSKLLTEALEQAKKARLFILDAMEKVIDKSRPEVKPHTPKMVKINIPKEYISSIIGPGGKIIQEMQKLTNTTITVDTVNDQGEVLISGVEKESIENVLSRIKGITTEPEVGEEYEGTVKSIMPYGAFIEFLPGKEALLHVSEISWSRIENVSDVLKEGDSIKVKLIGTDKRSGKHKLSRKVLIPNPAEKTSG